MGVRDTQQPEINLEMRIYIIYHILSNSRCLALGRKEEISLELFSSFPTLPSHENPHTQVRMRTMGGILR